MSSLNGACKRDNASLTAEELCISRITSVSWDLWNANISIAIMINQINVQCETCEFYFWSVGTVEELSTVTRASKRSCPVCKVRAMVFFINHCNLRINKNTVSCLSIISGLSIAQMSATPFFPIYVCTCIMWSRHFDLLPVKFFMGLKYWFSSLIE